MLQVLHKALPRFPSHVKLIDLFTQQANLTVRCVVFRLVSSNLLFELLVFFCQVPYFKLLPPDFFVESFCFTAMKVHLIGAWFSHSWQM